MVVGKRQIAFYFCVMGVTLSLIYSWQRTRALNSALGERKTLLSKLDTVQSLSRERGELLKEWSSALSAPQRQEVMVLLSEVQGLDMKVPVEMKRLEFVQERLTRLETEWLKQKNMQKLRPSKLTDVVYRLERSRKTYAEEAFRFNQSFGVLRADLVLPIFSAEEGFLKSAEAH